MKKTSMNDLQFPVSGAGLGLRREKLDEMLEKDLSAVNFLEVAPENWINVGGSLDLYAEWIRFDQDADIDAFGVGARWTF